MNPTTQKKVSTLRRAAVQAGNGAMITSDARGLEILEVIESTKFETVWEDPRSVEQALGLFRVVQAHRKA